MNVFSWVWLALFTVGFGVTETAALIRKDRPGSPATLSANIWWLTRGAGPWHQAARLALALGLAILTVHLLLGGPS